MKITKEFKVALLAIVAVAALYFGFNFLKGSNIFSSKNTFYVIYENVDGLNVSAPVTLSGMNVGIVKAMEILQDKDNQIRVTLEIEKEIEIGDSTIAVLASGDLLGGKTIQLDLNNNTRRYEGGELLISYTKKGIADILASKAGPIAGKIDTTMMRLNSLFDAETQNRIRSIIANTEASSAAAKNLMQMNERNIHQITSNVSQLTSSLKVTEAKFSRLATSLNEITDSLKKADIELMVRNMNATVTEAQTAVAKFNSNSGTIGKLMNDDSLYNNMNTAVKDLDALMLDFQRNPKRYVHFSVFGGNTKIDKAETVRSAKTVKEAQNVENVKTVEEIEKK